jgi:Pentapeptide repeats (8 copies)
MHFDELVSRYDIGERSFGSIHCWGELIDGNLQGIDLNGATLQAVRLRNSNLKGATLSRATITRSDLRGINLAYANLTEANFCIEPNYPNTLMSSSLRNANLEQTNLKDAVLSDNTTIQNAVLSWTIMPDGAVSHNPAMSVIDNKLNPLKRKDWKPITTCGDGSLTASKFADKPWLSADELYPLCSRCNTPLRFFLQLNLTELPEVLVASLVLEFCNCFTAQMTKICVILTMVGNLFQSANSFALFNP